MRTLSLITLGTTAIVLAACSDASAPNDNAQEMSPSAQASVYSSTPAGFEELSSSYIATGNEDAFMPDFNAFGKSPFGMGVALGHGRFGGPGFGLGLMGGGIYNGFIGGGIGSTHFLNFRSGKCSFDPGSGTVCSDTTHGGAFVASKTLVFKDSAGTIQQNFSSSTASFSFSSSVVGSKTRRDSSTSSIDAHSTQSVTGLRDSLITVNGASAGTESSSGDSFFGPFTATRTAADTITGLVVPKPGQGHPFPYPIAGKISRTISATVEIQDATLKTTRNETITYDGSATAVVVIVKDGVTQNCTMPLPFGKLTCAE